MPETQEALVAIGGNTPSPGLTLWQTLHRGLAVMADHGVEIVNTSSVFQTPCFPAGAGPDYLNAVLRVRGPGGVTPEGFLANLHRIEAVLGRTREIRWGARPLDLDLLAFGNMLLPDLATWDRWRGLSIDRQAQDAPNQLVLPHPRMQDRAFVLVPLAEIAADWVHPALNASVLQMLAALPMEDRDAVRHVGAFDSALVKTWRKA